MKLFESEVCDHLETRMTRDYIYHLKPGHEVGPVPVSQKSVSHFQRHLTTKLEAMFGSLKDHIL